MEISQRVAHATVVDCSLVSSSSSDSCSTLSSETLMAPTERTPLLIPPPSTAGNPSPPTTPLFNIKECFNWRTIGLFLIFFSGLAVSTYLLWRDTTDFLEMSYRLSLIQHDIWSSIQLDGLALLEPEKVVNVYVTHTGSEECTEDCPQLLQSLQGNLEELPYNFLMAGDCEAYEGRGWRYVSSYGAVPQNSSLVLAFVGDFTGHLPSSCQLEMAEALLRESQRRRGLQPGYQLYSLINVTRGERDAEALQRQLRQWPLYAGQQKVK